MATWAKGIDFKNTNNTKRIGGVGVYGTDATTNKLYIGLGAEPWNNAGIQLTSSAINFKGNKIYHAGDKPTASEIGAAPSSHTHSSLKSTDPVRPTSANIDVVADRSLSMMLSTSSMTTGKPLGDGYILNFNWDNNGGWASQLYVQNSGSPKMQVRGMNAGTWGEWNTLYGTNNKPTPADIGAAASSHTHNYAGSSSAGGSANTAVKLATARAINGTNFDGSANITTANWGTARTLTIGNTGKSVNGSGNVAWSLSEIGAAASNHSHNVLSTKGTNTVGTTTDDTTAKWGAQGNSIHWYTKSGCLNNQPSQYGYILNLGSGTEVHQLWMTQASGNLAHRGGNGSGWNGSWRTILDSSNYTNYAAASNHTHNYLPLSGGTLTGNLKINGNSKNLTIGTGGSDVYISNSASGKYLQLKDDGTLSYSDNKIYHSGNKPTASEIGAAASNHTHNYAGSSSAGGAANLVYLPRVGGSSVSANYQPGGNRFELKEFASDCANMPSAHWYHILTGQGSDANYNTQLALGMTNNAVYFRNRNSGAWGNWKQLAFTDSSITGNSATATKLKTARAINGTNFDGSGNITTANWGTARTLTIGNTGKSVNGSGNVTWSLSEIGAAASNHNHNGIYVNDKASVSGNMNNAAGYRNALGMINLSGTDATINPNGQTGWHHFINMSYSESSGSNMWQTQIANKAGTTDLWVRSRAGGAITDGTAWAAPWTRILTGSNYKSIVTPANIGAAASNHTHNYLPLSGGTLTGNIKFNMFNRNNTIFNIFNGDANGHHIRFGGGGATIVAAGEAGGNLESVVGTAETLTLASDQNIDFYTNCNTFDDRLKATLNTNLHFYPSVNGQGYIGTSSNKWNGMYANTFYGALSGNASTATKLQTARTINGTNFDGSANITTSNWGTTRTITIGNTGKSVNGSGNISWSLSEIGAAASSHNHGLLHDSFGTTIANTTTDNGWSMINSSYNGFLLKSLRSNSNAPAWLQGNYSAGIAFGGGDTKGVMSVSYNSPSVRFAGGNGSKPVWYFTVNGSSGKTYNMDSLAANTANTLTTARTINGTSFNGSANITTANWGTARNIQIGNTSKSVNGSGNVSWSLSEIGAAASSHTHNDYLPLSGGTLTGALKINSKDLVLDSSDSTTYGRLMLYRGDACSYIYGNSAYGGLLFDVRTDTNAIDFAAIMASKAFRPTSSGYGSIGTSTYKWGNVYADKINTSTVAFSKCIIEDSTTNDTIRLKSSRSSSTIGGLYLGTGSCRIYSDSDNKLKIEGGVYTNNTIQTSSAIICGANSGSNPSIGNQEARIVRGATDVLGSLKVQVGSDNATFEIVDYRWSNAWFSCSSAGCKSKAFTNTSDSRYKTNIEEVEKISDKLKNIKVYNYNYIDDFEKNNTDHETTTILDNIPEKRWGVLAQEIEKEFPELITEDVMLMDGENKNVKSVDIYGLTSLTLEFAKELQLENEDLKNKISILEDKIKKIEDKLGL